MSDVPISTSTLTGAHAELRPITPVDFEYLYSLELHPETAARWRFRGSTPNPETYARTLFDKVTATFIVYGLTSGRRAGLVSCYGADFRTQTAYVAALADQDASLPSFLVVEAVAILADYCFAVFPFRKLYFESPDFALTSFASAGASFLREEARLTDHDFFDGRYYDRVTLALARDEWAKHRGRLLGDGSEAVDLREFTYSEFIGLLEASLGIPRDRLQQPSLRLIDELGFDSLQLLELVVTCERISGAHMPEQLIPQIQTVADAYQWVSTRA